jgi:tetratricopeptide (TPR) repeat protein
MPLAIELAAAWVRLLPVAQIAEEIRGSLDLLERTGSASAEGRGYRSMRAAFEPSWALLAPREREVLAALSVLRAAFSRLAALAVAGASLAELASLADRSLLRGGDEGRFSMHPLMNRFAAEKLGERPDAERRALDAHAEYFLRTLAVHEAWHAIDQKAAIGQLALELPDALAALRRALALRRARQALAAIGVIGHFHEFTGRIEEGIALQDEVEAACADERDRAQLQARAQAALARSMLHYRAGRLEPSIGDARLAAQRYRRARDARGLRYAIDILAGALAKIGRHDEARRYSEQLLRAAERAGDSEHLALFLNNLALVESQCGFPDRALALYERSLAATRAIGDRAGIVAVLNNVATTLILTGRPGEALPLLADGLALADEAGFVAQRSYFLANLAQAEVELGHYDAARRRAEQGLDAIERGSDRSSAPACLVVLGRVAQAAGRPRDAAALLQQAIASARSMRVARHIVRTALAWARFAGEEGDPAGAARLLGCLRASGKPNAVESARIDALLVVLAPRLAADALAAALAEGGALALDDVLAGIAA